MKSADLAGENIARLLELFPMCALEQRDSLGNLQKKIDFEKLKLLLGEAVADDGERYEFTWAGKREAYLQAAAGSTKTLRPAREDSVNWDSTQNLYLEGDNLEVLKLLQKSYLGKVKMIYIDPPYNTGSDLIYDDDFRVSAKAYAVRNGARSDQGMRLRANTQSGGRFHSDWCSMIYPRLLLARNLLADDGAIFISIDDNEVENLKKIGHEVFGEANFIGQWNWYKSATPPNLSKKIKKNIEYILCYEKKHNSFKYRGIRKSSPSSNGLLNQTNREGILAFPAGAVEAGLADGLYRAGMYGTDRYRIELLDDVHVKNGLFSDRFRLRSRFKWSQEKLENELANGTKIAIRTASFSPSYEKTEYDPEVPPNLIDKSVYVDTTEQAGRMLAALFDNQKVFDYPKPVDLIVYLMDFLCGEEDLVMDFFSGSATTAHAVLQENARRGLRRKFILVQIPEAVDGHSEAARAGYTDICEIGRERIRRAIRKIKEETPDTGADLGFRVFRADESNMKETFFTPKEYTQMQLAGLESGIKPDRTELDLLFGCALDWGLPLSLPYEAKTVDGCTLHLYGNGKLAACFAEHIPESAVRAMALLHPQRAVFRDDGFSESCEKLNVEEIFHTLAPECRIKVI